MVKKRSELEKKSLRKENCFTPSSNKLETFTIMIPPPNVTGILHIGHILNNINTTAFVYLPKVTSTIFITNKLIHDLWIWQGRITIKLYMKVNLVSTNQGGYQ